MPDTNPEADLPDNNSDTAPVDDGKKTEKTVELTQDTLNSLNAEARRKGQSQGRDALMKELGLDKLGEDIDAKEVIAAALASQEESKTELQRLADKNAALEQQVEELTTDKDSALSGAKAILKQAAVKVAATQLDEYTILPEALDDVWTFISGNKELADLVDFDEENPDKVVGADKAVLKLIELKPYIAKKQKPTGPGTGETPKGKRTTGEGDPPRRTKPLSNF